MRGSRDARDLGTKVVRLVTRKRRVAHDLKIKDGLEVRLHSQFSSFLSCKRVNNYAGYDVYMLLFEHLIRSFTSIRAVCTRASFSTVFKIVFVQFIVLTPCQHDSRANILKM